MVPVFPCAAVWVPSVCFSSGTTVSSDDGVPEGDVLGEEWYTVKVEIGQFRGVARPVPQEGVVTNGRGGA